MLYNLKLVQDKQNKKIILKIFVFFIKSNFKIYLITLSRPIQILKYKEREEFFGVTNYIDVNNFEK